MSNENATDKQRIIDGLNEDLAREYQAIIQYVVFSSTLKGAEYGDIACTPQKNLNTHWRWQSK